MTKKAYRFKQGTMPQDRCEATGKVTWHSERRAKREAKYMRETFNDVLEAYVCPSCHKWHVGHGMVDKAKRKAAGVRV